MYSKETLLYRAAVNCRPTVTDTGQFSTHNKSCSYSCLFSHLFSSRLMAMSQLRSEWDRSSLGWCPFEKTLMLGKIEGGRRRDNRGWDGWMASLTQWTWVWVNSGSWWWTGRPGMLQSMGSQRVRHDWVTELNWNNQHPDQEMELS